MMNKNTLKILLAFILGLLLTSSVEAQDKRFFRKKRISTIKTVEVCKNIITSTVTRNWSWPGGTIESLRKHLMGPPHNHSSIILTLSKEELIALHNEEHNKHAALTGDYSPYIYGKSPPFKGRVNKYE